MTDKIVVAALYKFVSLTDYQALREPLLQTLLDNGIKGTLLLAEEGINGTVSGTRAAIDALLAWFRLDARLADIDHKESYCDEQPFYRTKVKLKKEIVTLGVPGVDPNQRVDYLSILENLEVEAGQAIAKVIINSRTGTIVIGQNVKVQPAAVTHGSLTVTITEDPIVSQPDALSGGQTAVVPRSRVGAEEEAKPMFKFGPGTSLDEIVRAVNQVGAAPSDLMAILEALKQAGALQADLIVI